MERIPNFILKYLKIQNQFSDRMNERTPSGAKASSQEVVMTIADEWCMSEARVREILNMELETWKNRQEKESKENENQLNLLNQKKQQ